MENDKGIYYNAPANQVEADTVYFARMELLGSMGYYAGYHNYNLKQPAVKNQVNVFINEYHYKVLARAAFLPQGKWTTYW